VGIHYHNLAKRWMPKIALVAVTGKLLSDCDYAGEIQFLKILGNFGLNIDADGCWCCVPNHP
jgi:hypothetical protein